MPLHLDVPNRLQNCDAEYKPYVINRSLIALLFKESNCRRADCAIFIAYMLIFYCLDNVCRCFAHTFIRTCTALSFRIRSVIFFHPVYFLSEDYRRVREITQNKRTACLLSL